MSLDDGDRDGDGRRSNQFLVGSALRHDEPKQLDDSEFVLHNHSSSMSMSAPKPRSIHIRPSTSDLGLEIRDVNKDSARPEERRYSRYIGPGPWSLKESM